MHFVLLSHFLLNSRLISVVKVQLGWVSIFISFEKLEQTWRFLTSSSVFGESPKDSIEVILNPPQSRVKLYNEELINESLGIVKQFVNANLIILY